VAEAGCIGTEVGPSGYNGYDVDVNCAWDDPDIPGDLTITSTATGAVTQVSVVKVRVDPDVGVEIVSWDSRTG
jgi:hypothetical protein